MPQTNEDENSAWVAVSPSQLELLLSLALPRSNQPLPNTEVTNPERAAETTTIMEANCDRPGAPRREACCLHWLPTLWRRGGTGTRPHPRSVNGGMTRSDPRVSSAGSANDGSTATDTGPGQLGCAKRGHLETTTVGRTKAARLFDYDVVANAADGFSSSSSGELEIGWSSSGSMFKGVLVSDEGLDTAVAIKVFHHRFSENTSKDVLEDLKGQPLRHRNLLCPLGYCFQKRKLYVVYEYMVNGSLDHMLFSKKKSSGPVLSWARRCSIIKGVAAGLHHLHSNYAVHGAIKASNILLDRDMTARLGDFGYSRTAFWISFKDSPYLAPECWKNTSVSIEPTCEMDIFYFGAVILEIVCGTKISNNRIPSSGFWYLEWVGKLYGEGQLLAAVDAALAEDFNKAEAEKLLLLGLGCSNVDPKQRPKAEDVVNILTGSISPLVYVKEADM